MDTAKSGGSIVSVVQRFVDCINEHDIKAMKQLMTDEHVLIDSRGAEVQGGAAVEAAWKSYFTMMPDYRMKPDTVMQDGNVVGLFGTATGTYAAQGGRLLPENAWKVQAAWKATVKGGAVSEWRAYVDSKPVYDIIHRVDAQK